MKTEFLRELSKLIFGDENIKIKDSEPVRLSTVLKAIDNIDKSDDFKKASTPLIKYLCENHHPHVTVIVTPTGAELLEGKESTGEILDFIKD